MNSTLDFNDKEFLKLMEGQKHNEKNRERRLAYLAHSVFVESQDGKELWSLLEQQIWNTVDPGPYKDMHLGQQNYLRWFKSLIEHHRYLLTTGEADGN